MTAEMFGAWHQRTFGCAPDEDLLAWVTENPSGQSQDGRVVWGARDIVLHTEEREHLALAGVLMIGTGDYVDEF